MADYCAQHTRLNYGVEGYREREVDHHHSGKETIGNILPNGTKHQTVHSSATTNSPSGGSQGSRKRVRHPEITSTALMRPISRESPGGEGTRAKISRQTRCFCEGRGAALLVARYTIRDLNLYLLHISFYILAVVFLPELYSAAYRTVFHAQSAVRGCFCCCTRPIWLSFVCLFCFCFCFCFCFLLFTYFYFVPLLCPFLATMPFAGYFPVRLILSAFPAFFLRIYIRFDLV